MGSADSILQAESGGRYFEALGIDNDASVGAIRDAEHRLAFRHRQNLEAVAAIHHAAQKAVAECNTRLDLAGLSARLKQAWHPAWGVPAADFPVFLNARFKLGVLLDSFAKQTYDARSVCGEELVDATLAAVLAYLSRQEPELKRNMADWYCNFAADERKRIFDRLNATAANTPLKLAEEAKTLLPKLEGAVTYWLSNARKLDPNRAEIAEFQQRVIKDIAELRDVPDFSGERLAPIEKAPKLSTTNGWGTTLYGRSNYHKGTDSYLTTRYLVACWIPLIPLGRYRVKHEVEMPLPQFNYGVSHNVLRSSYRFLGRVPLRKGDKLHVATFVAVVIALVIAAVIASSHSDSSISSGQNTGPAYSVTTPMRSSGSSVSSSPPYSAGSSVQSPFRQPVIGTSPSLSEIDANKTRLTSMEANLRSMESSLQSDQNWAEMYKSRLKRMESDMQTGTDVDRASYESALRQCNYYVDQYNSQLLEYNSTHDEYERLLDKTNKQVDEYNNGIGSH